ncbi:MAG TPA: transposase [Candidatus Omnitrophota bacterium]|nr:transposase [Candidatus Omnitrophota bacterium]
MPRSQRLNQAGLLHHVISRGNAGQSLFRDREDHLQYLSLLKQAISEHPLSLYNYVLMGNTVHLLVETKKDGALSKAMELVTREYAKYFNAKYNSVGHVFQGRFKSFTVQDDQYYIACSRYIDANPVKSGLVNDPKDYEWSGYRALAFGEKGEIGLDSHPLYENLGQSPKERQLVYKTLVQQKFGPELDLDERKAGILGSREFKKIAKAGGTSKDNKNSNTDYA